MCTFRGLCKEVCPKPPVVYNRGMFSRHAILKRCWIAMLIFALLSLPYHSVRACCCSDVTAGNVNACACNGCCCQSSSPPSSDSDGGADAGCETCQDDCKCQKRIEQNKVVRNVEQSSVAPSTSSWSYTIGVRSISISVVTVTTLDVAWLSSTYNQRRALSSVWLK